MSKDAAMKECGGKVEWIRAPCYDMRTVERDESENGLDQECRTEEDGRGEGDRCFDVVVEEDC